MTPREGQVHTPALFCGREVDQNPGGELAWWCVVWVLRLRALPSAQEDERRRLLTSAFLARAQNV